MQKPLSRTVDSSQGQQMNSFKWKIDTEAAALYLLGRGKESQTTENILLYSTVSSLTTTYLNCLGEN